MEGRVRRCGQREWFMIGILLSVVIVIEVSTILAIRSRSDADVATAQPDYVIEEIVPGRVIVVKLKANVVDRVYPFPQNNLVAGVAKVCEDFDIKDSLPIAAGNSVTTAVILSVEPKAPSQKVSK